MVNVQKLSAVLGHSRESWEQDLPHAAQMLRSKSAGSDQTHNLIKVDSAASSPSFQSAVSITKVFANGQRMKHMKPDVHLIAWASSVERLDDTPPSLGSPACPSSPGSSFVSDDDSDTPRPLTPHTCEFPIGLGIELEASDVLQSKWSRPHPRVIPNRVDSLPNGDMQTRSPLPDSVTACQNREHKLHKILSEDTFCEFIKDAVALHSFRTYLQDQHESKHERALDALHDCQLLHALQHTVQQSARAIDDLYLRSHGGSCDDIGLGSDAFVKAHDDLRSLLVASDQLQGQLTDLLYKPFQAYVKRQLLRKCSVGLAQPSLDRCQMSGLATSWTLATMANEPSILACSREFEDLSCYSLEGVLGRDCLFLETLATSNDAIEGIKRQFAKQEAAIELLGNYRKDGQAFINMLIILPLSYVSGKVDLYLAGHIDVTQILLQSDDLKSLAEVSRPYDSVSRAALHSQASAVSPSMLKHLSGQKSGAFSDEGIDCRSAMSSPAFAYFPTTIPTRSRHRSERSDVPESIEMDESITLRPRRKPSQTFNTIFRNLCETIHLPGTPARSRASSLKATDHMPLSCYDNLMLFDSNRKICYTSDSLLRLLDMSTKSKSQLLGVDLLKLLQSDADGRQLVLTGLSTDKARADETSKLRNRIEYAIAHCTTFAQGSNLRLGCHTAGLRTG
ncbi:hypothetical protein E5Q_02617 [Mixia osmundae IAM 14324]|uniref:PAS domain-containing protein n=1 Tax=Mixia osmundae (strain CBS 9802 / IAM 14324 / JCM 22182 / KY 12970) TaxID=764103 RepID=G7DZE9_MIXOS|nr:hypothetical protein E5Q_02617 [Mixia osmundae IAM 14324]